jgi:hypothetical protein
MTSKIFLGALSAFAVYVAIVVSPDVRRYLRIRAM